MRNIKTLIFLLFFYSCPLTANDKAAKEKRELEQILKRDLPSKLAKVFFKAIDIDTLTDALGSPDLKEENKVYYALKGFKYSLSIEVNESRITTIRYRFPSDAPSYSLYKDYVSGFKNEKISKGLHEQGRYFSVIDGDGLKLVFKNNTTKNLHSITRTIKAKE